MRNYWALLPAIAVIIGLILLYAIPTLINPQWTSSILALFRQFPEDEEQAADQSGNQSGTQAQNQRPAGTLGPQQIKSRRMLAAAMVVAAVALFGFNVSLNRESNACYQAATAWGAVHGEAAEDPCINMIYGTFFGDGTGSKSEDNSQPVATYQVVHKKKPTYLQWIQNPPKYDEVDLLFGTVMVCASDLLITEEEDKVVVLIDANQPCPKADDISLTPYKLKKPLGDRKVVTVDDKPVERINPDVDSWPTVVKKLVTGG